MMVEPKMKQPDDIVLKKIASQLVVLSVFGDKGSQGVIVHNKPKFFRKIFLRYLNIQGNTVTWKGVDYSLTPITNEMMLKRVPNIQTKIHYQVRRENKENDISYCKESSFLKEKESWSKEALTDNSDIKISLVKPSNISDKIWNSSNTDQRLFLIKLFGGILHSDKDDEGKYIDAETEKILCAFHIEGYNKKVNAIYEAVYKYKGIEYHVDLCKYCFREIDELDDVEIINFWGCN